MYIFKGMNINQIYQDMFDTVEKEGLDITARGFVTKEIRPVTIEILNPRERFVSSRNGFNTAFSVAEILWFLSGSSHKEMILHYIPSFVQFLDEGYDEFHGGYGPRIFRAGYDERKEYDIKPYINQFEECYKKLKKDINTRQAVITLWNPWKDNLQEGSKDYACNNVCYLKVREGKLYWTQVIRSNDLIFGTGQNVFQFTHFQEIMACWLGVDVGTYTQITDSLHVYQNDFYKKEEKSPNRLDIYNYFQPVKMEGTKEEFDIMLKVMLDVEKEWRAGKFDKIVKFPGYWNDFMLVLKIFNLIKYKKEKEAMNEWSKMKNEYQWSMANWMQKHVKDEFSLKRLKAGTDAVFFL